MKTHCKRFASILISLSRFAHQKRQMRHEIKNKTFNELHREIYRGEKQNDKALLQYKVILFKFSESTF